MTKHQKKAIELFNKFRNHTWNGEDNLDNTNAIKASIIAVDELIKYAKTFGDVTQDDVDDMEQVKKELQNL
jgi:hypothetical protein